MTDKGAIAATIILAMLLVVGSGIFLWQIAEGGILRTEYASKISVAILALVGAVATALLSLVGILIKYSIDKRAETRLEVERESKAALERGAEERLALEASIRAVQLLATPAGDTAPPIQRAGALFVLVSLRQYKLALALTTTLLAERDLSPVVAAQIIDDMLINGDDAVKEHAVSLLVDYPDRMLTSSSYELPNCLLDGCVGLTPYVREWGAVAMAKVLLARPLRDWRARESAVFTIVGGLALAWQSEKSARVKSDIAVILRSVLDVFCGDDISRLYHARGPIDVAAIRIEIDSVEVESAASEHIVDEVIAWGGADAP